MEDGNIYFVFYSFIHKELSARRFLRIYIEINKMNYLFEKAGVL